MKNLTNDELLERLANATATDYGAGGHSKGYRNEAKSKEYKDELISRGVDVPPVKSLLEVGKFNGIGSV